MSESRRRPGAGRKRPAPAVALLVVALAWAVAPAPASGAGAGAGSADRPPASGTPGAVAPGLTPSRSGAWTAKPLKPLLARVGPGRRPAAARVSVKARYTRGATVLLVTGGRYGASGKLWLQVALPVRPTGTRGWIPADATILRRTEWWLHVSTAKRRLTAYRAGRRARTMRVVVGKPLTPTPHGLFAVYERARLADPRGFVGPWALHLTAFSNVLFRFGAGIGQVAIHGRGSAALADPLGTARSNGCIRLRNRDIQWLRRRATPGTPVLITR